MILVIVFDEQYTVILVPIRLNYNLVKMWEDFDEWVEDNQTYLRSIHFNDSERIFLNSNDFIYWIKNCILEKDEHIRVLEQNVDRTSINNKYPKKKQHILYFENTGDGHLEYNGGTHRSQWHEAKRRMINYHSPF